MRAFHFYIDDWLSSKHIRRMDAAEERGYLRLLLHAASEPDCGLPNDTDELADISLLGPQWFKPTQDVGKCFRNQTSGEKVLANFFTIRDRQTLNAVDNTPFTLDPRHTIDIAPLRPDRVYNQRLLKEFQYHQAQLKQRQDAGRRSAEVRARGVSLYSNARSTTVDSPLDVSLAGSLPPPFQREGQRKGNNDVSVSVSVSSSSSEEQENHKAESSLAAPGPQLIPMRKPLRQEALAASQSPPVAVNGHGRAPDPKANPPDDEEAQHLAFWLAYCQATGKRVTQVDFSHSVTEWNSLSRTDQIAATRYIPEYVAEVGEPPGSKFFKRPVDYLANRRWTAVSLAPEPKPIRGLVGDEIV